MSYKNVLFIIIIIFFIYLLIPIESFTSSAYIESNNLINTSCNNIYDRQYVVDNVNKLFKKSEYNFNLHRKTPKNCIPPAKYNSCNDSCDCGNDMLYDPNNGCISKYPITSAPTCPVFSPSCPDGFKYDKLNNKCKSLCELNEIYDSSNNLCISNCQYELSDWGYCDLESKKMIRTVITQSPFSKKCNMPSNEVTEMSCLDNLDFSKEFDGWEIIYNPDFVIGPGGSGPKPNMFIKSTKDIFGFTFPSTYLQVQFSDFDNSYFYNVVPYPSVTFRTYAKLEPGIYSLTYLIQTRPNYPLSYDKRTVSIHSEVNGYYNVPFLFSKKDPDGNYIQSLPDETLLIPQNILFNVTEDDARKPIDINIIFTVNDYKNTKDCNVAIGNIKLEKCDHGFCPLNCQYSWDVSWSSCDPENAIVIQDPIIVIEAKHGGMACPARDEKKCNVDCSFNWLNNWSTCDTITGTQTRNPNILIQPKNDGKECDKPQTQNCDINCDYTWGDWSQCDPVTATRTRNPIIKTEPKNNGTKCPKPETSSCDLNCDFTWGKWSNCDPNTGTQSREPIIKNEPKNNGEKCPTKETRNCDLNCDFEWGPWSECDKKTGQISRKPIIKNESKNSGAKCPTTETKPCDVDCDFTWDNWSSCDSNISNYRDPKINFESKGSGKACPQRQTASNCKSGIFGGPGGGGYSFVCPAGSHITRINGKSGYWVDGIQVTCSNGQTSNMFGAEKGGGDSNMPTCDKGFSGVNLKYGGFNRDNVIGQISTTSNCGDSGNGTMGQARDYGNYRSGQASTTYNCPNDQKIVGIEGRSGWYLDALGFICG